MSGDFFILYRFFTLGLRTWQLPWKPHDDERQDEYDKCADQGSYPPISYPAGVIRIKVETFRLK
jgi:hypothetical protein